MKVNELCEIINGIAPFDSACGWDNCGLIVGDKDDDITGVYLCLDADLYALEKAKGLGCNVVVSHHPIIFGAISKITADTTAYHYIRAGVSVISVHTPLDMAEGGVNDVLAAACGLQNIQHFILDGMPLGRVGTVSETDGYKFIDGLKKSLGVKACDCIIKRPVSRVCTISGSGGSGIYDAYLAGCDTLVTGEAKHDGFVLADNLGINLITLGHFETENIVLKPLFEKLSKAVKCFVSDRQTFIERR